jgi:glycosyltransferase involved in cell wall biosynthesis
VNVLDITIHVGLSRPKNGAQERYANLTKELTTRGNGVVVLEAVEFVDPQDTSLAQIYTYSDLKLFGRTLRVFRDLAPSFTRAVLRILRESAIDLIQISHPSGALAVKVVTLLTARGTPLVYAPHNVESELLRETFSNDPRYTGIERLVLPRYVSLLERFVCRFLAERVIAVSERDRDEFVRRFRLPPTKVSVIPSGCSLDQLPTEGERSRARREEGIHDRDAVVVFHGYYPYPPNRDAFDVIERYVAPRLRAMNPNVVFLMGGTGAPEFERQNVRSIGFIEDLPRFLAAGDVAAVPIVAGSGTRLKIFQYMNAGLPIVSTEKGVEGVAATNGEHALIVPRINEQFVDRVACLLENRDERARLATNARKLLAAKYTWGVIGSQLVAVYARVLEGCRGS